MSTLYTKLSLTHHREHCATINVLSLLSASHTKHVDTLCG